jgi:hypothetical protein
MTTDIAREVSTSRLKYIAGKFIKLYNLDAMVSSSVA